MPGKRPSTTNAVTDAAHVARVRYVEEELKTVSRKLAALAARVGELKPDGTARASLVDQRLDELVEDFETQRVRVDAKLDEVFGAIEHLEGTDDTATMLAPPEGEREDLLKQTAAHETRVDEKIDELTQRFDALERDLTQQFEERLATALAAMPSKSSNGSKVDKKAKASSLTDVKGIGPASAKKLVAEGVQTPAQVATWSTADIERLHSATGTSLKRLRSWHASAKEL